MGKSFRNLNQLLLNNTRNTKVNPVIESLSIQHSKLLFASILHRASTLTPTSSRTSRSTTWVVREEKNLGKFKRMRTVNSVEKVNENGCQGRSRKREERIYLEKKIGTATKLDFFLQPFFIRQIGPRSVYIGVYSHKDRGV